MEIGPIFRAMRQNRARVALLVLEIAFTIAVALNCLNLIGDQRRRILRPSGLDEENLLSVVAKPWGADFDDAEYRSQLVDRDLAALRALPGVRSASAMAPFPLQGGGSSFTLKPLGAPDSARVRSPVYTADEHVLDTLGLELVAGRSFTAEDLPAGNTPEILNILVTQDLADALFPDGDALGKTVDTGSAEYPDVITGIVREMVTPYGGGPMESRITIYPGKPSDPTRMRYLVRAEPGALELLQGTIDETLLGIQNERTVELRTMLDIKGSGYGLELMIAQILSAIVALLITVTALGIYGITSFSVTQRTKQVGTRRALGASQVAIVRHFLVECTLISGIGLVLGVGAAVGLNVFMVHQVEASRLSPTLAVAGVVLLWLIGVAATIVPALRASRLSPALATRAA